MQIFDNRKSNQSNISYGFYDFNIFYHKPNNCHEDFNNSYEYSEDDRYYLHDCYYIDSDIHEDTRMDPSRRKSAAAGH